MKIENPIIKSKLHRMLDRYPSRPYISEGHPMNQTAVVSGNVTFRCPVVSDIAAHITWAKYRALNDNDTDSDFPSPPNTVRFQVYSKLLIGRFKRDVTVKGFNSH